MRIPLAAALMLCRLAKGLGFPQTVATGAALSRPGSRSLSHARGGRWSNPISSPLPPPQAAATLAGAANAAPGVDTIARSMVLRPDWEREGRVFGLQPPPRKERVFEYLVDYPCDFEIKVIGVNEGSFANDIAATVSVACEVEASDVRFTVRDTSSGRYQSITVHAPVKSADMLYRCYELIDEDPRVKFKF